MKSIHAAGIYITQLQLALSPVKESGITVQDISTLLISLAALAVSMVALIYTVKPYLLKTGARVRGYFQPTSTIDCNDKYIHSFLIENLKDRALVVYGIYLKFGHGHYIQLEEFEKEPLILKPFEAHQQNYDPIILYSCNMKRINMNSLFDFKKQFATLILSTSEGRVIVEKPKKAWEPMFDWSNNLLTAIIHPIRLTYKGRAYGSNVKFLVEFTFDDESINVIQLRRRDFEFKMFEKFSLTEESLETVESLKAFFEDRKSLGILKYKSIEIIDWEDAQKKIIEEHREEIAIDKHYNWFYYHVLGRLGTWLEHRKNIKNTKRANSKKHATSKSKPK